MTHVADPLEQLGALTVELGLERMRAARAAALGRVERCLGTVGTLLFLSAAGLSLAPHLGAVWLYASLGGFDPGPAAREALGASVPAVASVARPEPVLASLFAPAAPVGLGRSARSRTSLLALAGERLPADVAALRETQVANLVTPPVSDAALVREASVDVRLVQPQTTVMLTQLPAQSSLSKGVEISPGVWALALQDLAGLNVTLPPGGRRQVTARVEIDGNSGGEVQSYGLVVSSGSAASRGVEPRESSEAEDAGSSRAGSKVTRPVRRAVAAARPRPLPWAGYETKANAGVPDEAPITPAADPDAVETAPSFGIGKAWSYAAGH